MGERPFGDIDRRTLLSGAAGLALVAAPVTAAAADGEADSLGRLLDRIFWGQTRESPQAMTSLGLDTGKDAWARSRLDDQSRAAADRRTQQRAAWIAELNAIDRSRLLGLAATSYDCVLYDLERTVSSARRFDFGRSGFPSPYLLTQLNGAYQVVPDFLDSQHVVETTADAEAYLSRLREFVRVLDHETDRASSDGRAGVTPPGFILDKALVQMRAVRGAPLGLTSLVQSLARRTREKGIAGDWAGRAASIVQGEVWPALDRQIALLESWRPKAGDDAGLWRLEEGADYYRFATRFQTTTTLSPAEIHALGLSLVDELSAEADRLFRANGLGEGSVGERYAALFRDTRFIYPNTEKGRAELFAYVEGRVAAVTARLPAWFGRLPKAALDVRRVPAALEAGAPGAYYQDPSIEGSRPGAYYINLRDTAEHPRWTLPTVTFHEGVPGHHLQGALALEAPDLPMIRRTLWFTAYGEGWALYSEQLTDEIGLYADDPWGRLGYLKAAIFRAVRLVLDSGIHDRRWSRAQAVRYFVEKTGDPRTVAETEVDRYCVWPGQACSYMIGKASWLRLRAMARDRLGSGFDIRAFHDAGLLTGPMPLEVLERHITAWTEQVA